MKRRDFITSTVLATASLANKNIFAETKKIKNIGVQLFSVPKLLSENFESTIKMLANMGYKEIEMYGPYDFSAEKQKIRWAEIAKQLGFSGSGYFGKTASEVSKIFNDNGLKSPSAHTDLDTLKTKMGSLAEAANILGQKYVILPSIPEEERKTLDDYKRIADTFNSIGENAKKHGIRFAYHNHGYGIKPMDGQIPLDLILNETYPNLVFFEMDIYWTSAGGANPIDYLKKYPNRYKLMHLKDMKEKKTFAGDGNNPTDWIALFPLMTTAGDGVLDVKKIIETAHNTGVKHFYIEQDMVNHPEISMKRSFDNVEKMAR